MKEFIDCPIRILSRQLKFSDIRQYYRPCYRIEVALHDPQFCGYVHIDTKGNESDIEHITEIAKAYNRLMKGEKIVVRFIEEENGNEHVAIKDNDLGG